MLKPFLLVYMNVIMIFIPAILHALINDYLDNYQRKRFLNWSAILNRECPTLFRITSLFFYINVQKVYL